MQIKLFCFNVMFYYVYLPDDPCFNRASCSVLGRASNTEIYRPLEKHSKVSEVSASPGKRVFWAFNDWQSLQTSETMQGSSLRQSRFPFSATRCQEWRYWLTMGPFIMETVTSSERRWAGCWAWRQRRSAAGRRPEKPWRSGREKSPWTPWYVSCTHRIQSATTQ